MYDEFEIDETILSEGLEEDELDDADLGDDDEDDDDDEEKKADDEDDDLL